MTPDYSEYLQPETFNLDTVHFFDLDAGPGSADRPLPPAETLSVDSLIVIFEDDDHPPPSE